MPFTENKLPISVIKAKAFLKPGDKIRVLPSRCMAKKVIIVFSHWDGQWMVSITGRNEYHPDYIDQVNGEPKNFK